MTRFSLFQGLNWDHFCVVHINSVESVFSVEGWAVWLKIIGAIKVLDQAGRFIPVIWNKGVSQGQWVICISTCNYHSSLSLSATSIEQFLPQPTISWDKQRPTFHRNNKAGRGPSCHWRTGDDRQSNITTDIVLAARQIQCQWREK